MVKNLLKRIARLMRINFHENARKLIEHVRFNSVEVEEDSVSPRIILSKEELIDGKYFYKLRYGTDENGDYVYAFKTVKELNEVDIKRTAVAKLTSMIAREIKDNNVKLTTFKLKNENYLSILSFMFLDEKLEYKNENEDKMNSKLEVLYEAVKYLRKK